MTEIEHDDETGTTGASPPGGSSRFLPQTTGQRLVAVVFSLLFVVAVAQIFRTAAPYVTLDTSLPDQHPKRNHARAIIERDGRRLLWAKGMPDSKDAEWFDVTDSVIDPEKFQYGIGKDTIASIDAPQFAEANDPRLADARIDDDTQVLGYVHDGDARAYPLHILNQHELVNDTVGGKPVTVGW